MSSERDDDIVTWVDTEGRVSLADLAERFGVSEMTIRRDLDALTVAGRLRRVRGGAVRIPSPGEEPLGSTAGLSASRGAPREQDAPADAPGPVITPRRDPPVAHPGSPVEPSHREAGDQPDDDPPVASAPAPTAGDGWRRAAAVAIASLVPGGAVLLTAGPATLALARAVAQVCAAAPHDPTTVVVTSLEPALALAHAPGVRLVLLGGEADATRGSGGQVELVGPAALAALDDLHLDLVVLSPAGLDARGAWAAGTGSAQLASAALRVVAAGGGRAVAVVGPSALGRPGLVRAAPLSALQQVVAVVGDGEDPSQLAARLQAVAAAAPRSPDLVTA